VLSRRIGRAEVRFTDTADGDLRTDASARARIHAAPWSLLHQVHGGRVVVVDEAGAYAGADADAAVTRVDDAPLVVMTADCAPVALVAGHGDDTVVAVAHAGWRGLVAGVIRNTVDAMRDALGDDRAPVTAVVGPCIHAECYEFGEDDLAPISDALGPAVRGVTSTGTTALDLPAAVRASLERNDVLLVHEEDACTAHTSGYWSHRARTDKQRQATVAWLV